MPAELVLRPRFNPELNGGWFQAVMGVVNSVTMLSIILTGAALIREDAARRGAPARAGEAASA